MKANLSTLLTGALTAVALVGVTAFAAAPSDAQPSPSAQAQVPAGFTEHKVKVGEVGIDYVEGGHGPTLVLLHGYPQSWYEWHKVMPELAKHYHVVAPSLRGAGKSDAPASGYDKKTLAADIHGLMQKIKGGDHIYLVGHDSTASRRAPRNTRDGRSRVAGSAMPAHRSPAERPLCALAAAGWSECERRSHVPTRVSPGCRPGWPHFSIGIHSGGLAPAGFWPARIHVPVLSPVASPDECRDARFMLPGSKRNSAVRDHVPVNFGAMCGTVDHQCASGSSARCARRGDR